VHYRIFWIDKEKDALKSIRANGTDVQHWLFTPPVNHLVIYKV